MEKQGEILTLICTESEMVQILCDYGVVYVVILEPLEKKKAIASGQLTRLREN